jgi:hypothetical protein
VRAKNACRVFLAVGDRAGMVKQRAQRAALNAHVDAKHVLAQEIVERAPGWKLGECNSTLMTRRRP